jgi:hypothetical protein
MGIEQSVYENMMTPAAGLAKDQLPNARPI